MPTVLRKEGFEIKIYFNDHAPRHVHVFKDEGEVKINLDPGTVVRVWKMSSQETRKAKRIVIENQKYLLEKWQEIHGLQNL